MSLDMLGTVDQCFKNTEVTITPIATTYVDGSPVEAPGAATIHNATTQPASAKEIQFLEKGGERFTSVKRFYINDGSTHEVGSLLADSLTGKNFRITSADNRPTRNYCKLIAGSEDK